MDDEKREELRSNISNICKRKFQSTNAEELNQINALVSDMYNRAVDMLSSTREISPKAVENFCEEFKYSLGTTLTKLNFESMDKKIEVVEENLDYTFKRFGENKEKLANNSDLAIKDGIRIESNSYNVKVEERVSQLVDAHFSNLRNFPSNRVVEASDDARRYIKGRVIQVLKDIHHESNSIDLRTLEFQVSDICNELIPKQEENVQNQSNSFRDELAMQTESYGDIAKKDINDDNNEKSVKDRNLEEYSI